MKMLGTWQRYCVTITFLTIYGEYAGHISVTVRAKNVKHAEYKVVRILFKNKINLCGNHNTEVEQF